MRRVLTAEICRWVRESDSLSLSRVLFILLYMHFQGCGTRSTTFVVGPTRGWAVSNCLRTKKSHLSRNIAVGWEGYAFIQDLLIILTFVSNCLQNSDRWKRRLRISLSIIYCLIIELLVVITDYKVRSMLHDGALEEVVIVKRNMEENIEHGKMKWSQNNLYHSSFERKIYYLILQIFYI